MERAKIERSLHSMIDELAAIEHERWSHWQRYVHDKGTRQADGSLVIPQDIVAQWDRQIATPYADLSEKEKESDREQVRKYLPTIIEGLANKASSP